MSSDRWAPRRRIGRWLAAGLAAWIVAASGQCAQAQQSDGVRKPALERGGSDYLFFGLNGCSRSGLFVVPGYDTHRALIDQQLAVMYQGGQRRLRIALPLDPDPEKGPFSDGPLAPEYRQSIVDFLGAVHRVGYEEILVAIGGGRGSPLGRKPWDEAYYRLRWNRIVEFRNLLAGSGLHYRIDLFNEGIPTRNQPQLLEYARRLWSDYVRAFGTADTVGFSIIPAPWQDRFAQIAAVYQGRLPPVFDVHVYDQPGMLVANAHNRLSQLGFANIPWIIGETFYNDRGEAQELSDAITRSGQKVLFLLQWPLTPERRCKGVDVEFPARFDNYIAYGF